MTAFTTDNSEFSATECATFNAAFDALQGEYQCDADPDYKNLSDKLNNAWIEGITANELVAKIRRQAQSASAVAHNAR